MIELSAPNSRFPAPGATRPLAQPAAQVREAAGRYAALAIFGLPEPHPKNRLGRAENQTSLYIAMRIEKD